MYSEKLFNALYIEIKHKCLKKISDMINATKNALLLLS